MARKHEQLAFYNDIMSLFSKEELEGFLLNQNEFFRSYAEEYWLLKYHKLKKKSMTTHVPSITSFISDMPSSFGTNAFNSTTEDCAFESIDAEEKLQILYNCINKLPYEFRELIQEKYFQRRSDGKLYEDSYIYDTLGLSRSQYYRMKKRALTELGEILYQAHYNALNNERRIEND